MDVMTTFLHEDLEEEICMKQPKGFAVKGKKEMVSKYVSSSSQTWFFSLDLVNVPIDGVLYFLTTTSKLLNNHVYEASTLVMSRESSS